jgi:hypothetical protein
MLSIYNVPYPRQLHRILHRLLASGAYRRLLAIPGSIDGIDRRERY